jgi:DNA-binding MarR family transcriptional regulator
MGITTDEAPIASSSTTTSPILEILFRISKSSRELARQRLAELKLFPGQDELLLVLSRAEPVPVCDLAAALGVVPATTSKMIDYLSDRWLVKRLRNPYNRRQTLIAITEEGETLAERIRTQHNNLEREINSAFPSVAERSIDANLSIIDNALRASLARLR